MLCVIVMDIDFSTLNGTDFVLGVFGSFFVEAYRFKILNDKGAFSWQLSRLVPHIIWVLTFLAASGFLAAVQGVSPQLSAFYAGLTSPVFFAAILKDNTQAQRELAQLEKEKEESNRTRDELIEAIKELHQSLAAKDTNQQEQALSNREKLRVILPKIPTITQYESELTKPPEPLIPEPPGASPAPATKKRYTCTIVIGILLAVITAVFGFFSINVGYLSPSAPEPQPLPQPPSSPEPEMMSDHISWIFLGIFLVIVLSAAFVLLFWIVPRIYRKARKSKAFQTFLSGLV